MAKFSRARLIIIAGLVLIFGYLLTDQAKAQTLLYCYDAPQSCPPVNCAVDCPEQPPPFIPCEFDPPGPTYEITDPECFERCDFDDELPVDHPDCKPPDQTEVIVDNQDEQYINRIGMWQKSEAETPWSPDGTEPRSLYCSDTAVDGAACSISYRPPIQSGWWKLEEWHPCHKNRTDKAEHTIETKNGATLVQVNQTCNGSESRWNELGVFEFNGATARITITAAAVGKPQIGADAFRLTPIAAPIAHVFGYIAPTQNDDDSALTDLASIMCRNAQGNMVAHVLASAGQEGVVSFTTTAGTERVTCTAVKTSGKESDPSNELEFIRPPA